MRQHYLHHKMISFRKTSFFSLIVSVHFCFLCTWLKPSRKTKHNNFCHMIVSLLAINNDTTNMTLHYNLDFHLLREITISKGSPPSFSSINFILLSTSCAFNLNPLRKMPRNMRRLNP